MKTKIEFQIESSDDEGKLELMLRAEDMQASLKQILKSINKLSGDVTFLEESSDYSIQVVTLVNNLASEAKRILNNLDLTHLME